MNKDLNISFETAKKKLTSLAKETHGFEGPIQWIFFEDVVNYNHRIFIQDTFMGINPPIAEKIFKVGMYQGFGITLECLGFSNGRLICTIDLLETKKESELKMVNGLKASVLANPEKIILVKNRYIWSFLKFLVTFLWPLPQYAVVRELMKKEKLDEKIERLISSPKDDKGVKNAPKFKKLKDVAHNLLQNICGSLCWVDDNYCLNHVFLAAQKANIQEVELNILQKNIEPRTILSPAISHVLQNIMKDYEYLLRTISFPADEIKEVKIRFRFDDLKNGNVEKGLGSPEFLGEIKIKTCNGKWYSAKRSQTP